MARKAYRYTIGNFNRTVATNGTAVFKIEPLENQQTMTARLKTVKVSIIPSGPEFSQGGFLIHASTDSNTSTDNIITSQAVGDGGGTVWLAMKNRAIRDEQANQSRNDGPIYIWVRSSGFATPSDIILEAWGSQLDVDAL